MMKNYWYCVHTRPKQEELVEKRLYNLSGIEVFSPKIKVKKRVRSCPVEAIEHLFPSYLFARFGEFNYFHMIMYTRGVKRFVGNSSGWPFIVDDAIVEIIKSRMEDGLVQVEPHPLQPGESVTITAGPLRGLTGILLEETKARERVLILLSTLHYHGRVQVQRDFVEKISSAC